MSKKKPSTTKKPVTSKPLPPRPLPLKVKIEPWGPTPEAIAAAVSWISAHASVKAALGKARFRLLNVQLIDEPVEAKAARMSEPPSRIQATFYDYTNQRAIKAITTIANRRSVDITESAEQPLPSNEEYAEAVSALSAHADLGSHIREGRLQPYASMPPLLLEELPDGRFKRTLAVGLLPASPEVKHEIVGFDLADRAVIRFGSRAPGTAQAHNPICGIPWGNLGDPNRTVSNAPGQALVTISQGQTVLWKFVVLRPAATAGPGLSTNGTGVELRFVDYRGKRLLYRGHVPILNVKYKGDACGPYRDWQHTEGKFDAQGADPVPGFRLCNAPPKTILDSGSDQGNFNGVAVFASGTQVTLVSEMEAGWYRYISEWHFHADGTLQPRFGFSAAQNSCVCNIHYHHVYWRLDFDIKTPGNNLVREFNNPCLPGFCPSNWHDKLFEIKRYRDPARKRRWRVENTTSGDAYDIIPGATDGSSITMPDSPFGRGDFWVLRYRATEIDDGVVAIGPPYEAGIDTWVNGESTKNQDVVVWYGAHFTHDISQEPPGTFGERVGPDLAPVKW